jgi:hypothetical protein
MRADRTNSSDGVNAPHEEGEVEGTFFLRGPEDRSLRHIACTNGLAICGEVLDLSKPLPSFLTH